MDNFDLALRNETYSSFVSTGTVPAPASLASALGAAQPEVAAGLRRLHDAHALVLDSRGVGIRMLNPFSLVPTAHRVQAMGRWWYANCAWDALGIGAALGSDSFVQTSCPDCAEPVEFALRDGAPGDTTLLFHCLVPASHWWDDIGFT